MRYVYLIQSLSHPDERYVGITDDLKRRLRDHNSGESRHTAKYRRWTPIVVVRFTDDVKARAFERYLKSGSGRVFAKRHLW